MGIDYSSFRKIPLYDENGQNSKSRLVGSGEWLGFKFYIVSVGSHPNAYIELNKDEIKKPWDCIIDVHGGITYQEEVCHYPFKEMKGKPMIGWDYAHCDDFYISLRGPVDGKKWTSDEIVDDCVSVIEQILKELRKPENR